MRRFLLGFLIALLLFVGVNLLVAHVRSDCGLPALLGASGCADDIRRAGFPLQFWEEGGFAFRQVFSLPALLVDLGVGLALSVAAGWAASRLWPGRPARR
jgi:hypothetical protein